MTEYWYRYNIMPNLSLGLFGNDDEPDVIVQCEKIRVEHHTPCGVRLYYPPKGKMVFHDHPKQFASKTKERALECFIARKRRQIEILTAQLKNAKDGLALAEKGEVHD